MVTEQDEADAAAQIGLASGWGIKGAGAFHRDEGLRGGRMTAMGPLDVSARVGAFDDVTRKGLVRIRAHLATGEQITLWLSLEAAAVLAAALLDVTVVQAPNQGASS